MIASSPAIVGPWAKEKLEALERYLDAYTTVLKNQTQWRTIYVDAFAGGGRSLVRPAATPRVPLLEQTQIDSSEVELIKGSPRIALDIPNPFNRYIFIEPSPIRVAELQKLQTEYIDRRTIDIRQTVAADGIEWLLGQRISKRTHRGVAFLDPFGANLDWRSIEVLAATGVFEVIINFPLDMAIARMIPNTGDIPESWQVRRDSYFGTRDWRIEVFEQHIGLFGKQIVKREDYRARLLAFHRKRLKAIFGKVSQPRLIRNTQGTPLYHLLWAGPHEKGLQIADYVLQMGEREPPTKKG